MNWADCIIKGIATICSLSAGFFIILTCVIILPSIPERGQLMYALGGMILAVYIAKIWVEEFVSGKKNEKKEAGK